MGESRRRVRETADHGMQIDAAHPPPRPCLLGDALDVRGAAVGLYAVVILHPAFGAGVDLRRATGKAWE